MAIASSRSDWSCKFRPWNFFQRFPRVSNSLGMSFPKDALLFGKAPCPWTCSSLYVEQRWADAVSAKVFVLYISPPPSLLLLTCRVFTIYMQDQRNMESKKKNLVYRGKSVCSAYYLCPSSLLLLTCKVFTINLRHQLQDQRNMESKKKNLVFRGKSICSPFALSKLGSIHYRSICREMSRKYETLRYF